MKTKIITAMLALAFSGASFGACVDSPGASGCGGSISGPSTTNLGSGAGAGQNAFGGNATQGQQQGQGQLQGQQQGNVNTVVVAPSQSNSNRNSSRSNSESESNASAKNKNAQDVSFEQNTYNPNDITIRSVPSIALPNIYPTAPCMGSTSIGGSGVGFSVGIGSSWKDADCGLRETARAFAGLNMKDDAIAVLCASSYAEAAPACKALAPKKAEAAPATMKMVDQGGRTEADRKSDAAVKGSRTVVGVAQPVNCVADEFIARRQGSPVCK